MSDYDSVLSGYYTFFRGLADPDKREHGSGWSIKEIIGHLVDSCSNNHQRLARLVPGANLNFPGYDQETFVTRAAYVSFDYGRLVELWHLYNALLLHSYRSLPADLAERSTISVGDRPAVNVHALIADYFRHMSVHVNQIRQIVEA